MISSLKKLFITIIGIWFISFCITFIIAYKRHYFSSTQMILGTVIPTQYINTGNYELPARHAWYFAKTKRLTTSKPQLELIDRSQIKRYEWKHFALYSSYLPDSLSRFIIETLSKEIYSSNNQVSNSLPQLYYNSSEIDVELDAYSKEANSPPKFHIFSPIDAHKHEVMYFKDTAALYENAAKLINYVTPLINHTGAIFSLPRTVFGLVDLNGGYQTLAVNALESTTELKKNELLIASLPIMAAPRNWSAMTASISHSEAAYIGLIIRYNHPCQIEQNFVFEFYDKKSIQEKTFFFDRRDIMKKRYSQCEIKEINISTRSAKKQTVTITRAGYLKI